MASASGEYVDTPAEQEEGTVVFLKNATAVSIV